MIAAARLLAVRPALFILFLCTLCLSLPTRAAAADHPTRVLFVGGDWKSQLTNYQQKTPLRGHFVQQQVDAIAPGEFIFTFWTSYEFLQYGDEQSLAPFNVIVVGDTMGQSVLPRWSKASAPSFTMAAGSGTATITRLFRS